MGRSLPERFNAAPRKVLAAANGTGHNDRKRLAVERQEDRRWLGRMFEAALEDAHVTKQQAARALGFGDNQAPISRWIGGLEPLQLRRVFQVLGVEFQEAFVARLWCEIPGARIRRVLEREGVAS